MTTSGSEALASPTAPAGWSDHAQGPSPVPAGSDGQGPAPIDSRDDGLDRFRALLRNLPWPATGSERCVQLVGMTSCYRGEGVSTIAALSALAAARSGDHRVLLVDANLADPSVHQTFGLPAAPGLADVVSGAQPHRSAVRPTRLANLCVLPAGDADAAGVHEATGPMATLLVELKRQFELVIVDMPAAGQGTGASHLYRLFDGVVLVIQHERVRWEVAQRVAGRLRQSGANLVGAVLNKRHQHIPEWLYRRL